MVLVRTTAVTKARAAVTEARSQLAAATPELATAEKLRISAVKRSIGFTIGFHNHGEGPYLGLLLVESVPISCLLTLGSTPV